MSCLGIVVVGVLVVFPREVGNAVCYALAWFRYRFGGSGPIRVGCDVLESDAIPVFILFQ